MNSLIRRSSYTKIPLSLKYRGKSLNFILKKVHEKKLNRDDVMFNFLSYTKIPLSLKYRGKSLNFILKKVHEKKLNRDDVMFKAYSAAHWLV